MDLKQRLTAFNKELQKIYPTDIEIIWQELKKSIPVAFTINTLKFHEEDIKKELAVADVKFKLGPFNNTYILKSDKNVMSSFFTSGKVYFQRLSSNLPILLLDLKPGERILDMCAAPGGKAFKAAQVLDNDCKIFCIENNKARLHSLQHSLQILGVINPQLFYENAASFPFNHPNFVNYFDKVILDAPCSNESLINPDDEKSVKYWNPKIPKSLSSLQKKLLASAIKLVKPGGKIVYSTCTFNAYENELVVEWALRKFPNVKVAKHSFGKSSAFRSGLTEFQDVLLNPDLDLALRVVPDGKFSAFFAIVLDKSF